MSKYTKPRVIVFGVLLICLSIVPSLPANQQHTCKKWDVLDLAVQGDTDTHAFGVDFGATFIHSSGERLKVAGFYNGDLTWVVRFCACRKGQWQYETYASQSALAGKKGTIQVSTNDPDVHGPIVIDPANAQRFSYADGTPYFLLAFELDWLFALDWDNAHDIPKTREIIDQVAENNFNHLIMNVYAYDASWGHPDEIRPEHYYAEPMVFPFGGSNEKPDYASLNVPFFQHLDRVIAHLNEKQIVAHLMIYVWNKKVNWPPADSQADNLYFDYVVKRYQAYPNLVWDISKEALGYGHNDMGYITGRIDRLRELDAYGRLLTVHDYGYCNRFPDKVDFISTQNWRYNLYDNMYDNQEKHSEEPVFNIEHGGYETSTYRIFKGAYDDAITCLDRNYQCVFAGVYSTYYWQNASWYNVIYNPNSLPPEEQPKFAYYKHLGALFKRYHFSTLAPTQSGTTTYCLTDNSKMALFYVPDNMLQVSCNLKILKKQKVQITWFNPLTGTFHAPETIDFRKAAWHVFRRNKRIPQGPAVAILEVQ